MRTAGAAEDSAEVSNSSSLSKDIIAIVLVARLTRSLIFATAIALAIEQWGKANLNAALLPRLTPEQEERSQWEDDAENQVHHLSTLDNDHKDKDDVWMQMVKIWRQWR